MGTPGISGYSLSQKAKQKANIVQALELYQDGKSHREIAEIMGIGRTTIAKYIGIALNEIAKVSAANIDVVRAELKERMLFIQQEAITAWQESKTFTKKFKKKIKKTGGKDFGDIDSIEIEEGHGDPRYLHLAKEAGDSIAQLFGINVAVEKPVVPGETQLTIDTSKDGSVVVKTTWGTMAPTPKPSFDAEIHAHKSEVAEVFDSDDNDDVQGEQSNDDDEDQTIVNE